MGHLAHFLLVLEGEVLFTSEKWGALGLAVLLAGGPEAMVSAILGMESATQELSLIPEDFMVMNVAGQELWVSPGFGLTHLSTGINGGRTPQNELERRVFEHLWQVTPSARAAFLRFLRRRWPGWQIREARGPARHDWSELPELEVAEVLRRFAVLPEPLRSEAVRWGVSEAAADALLLSLLPGA